jgi:antirestriction protein ArdC
MKRDIQLEITAKIVAKLETCGPWRRPWSGLLSGMPANASTGNAYKGVNVLVLCMTDYSRPLWATYKQWEALGAQVRKGEKSEQIVKWAEKTQETNGTERKFLIPCAANVFNVAQVDGYEAQPLPREFDPHEKAEQVMTATGARINYGGAKAFYAPAFDSVQLPERAAFKSADGFYATAFHELGHWTGHEKRCNRQFGKRFGDEAYAFEELVAELSAAFLCAETGVNDEPREDHASYVKSWVSKLKDDKTAIFTAASQASKAAEFIKAFSAPREERKAA